MKTQKYRKFLEFFTCFLPENEPYYLIAAIKYNISFFLSP